MPYLKNRDVCHAFFRFLQLVVLLCLSCPEVSLRAQAKSKWEKQIAAFETQDKASFPASHGVLFLGSSSIRRWDTLLMDFPEHQVINRGFGGSRIQDSIHFFNRIVSPYKPSSIVFYAGDNDIAGGHTADDVYDHFKDFAELVHEHLPKTQIVFISIKPSIKRWHLSGEMDRANNLIRSHASLHRRIAFADIWNPMIGLDGKPRPELFAQDDLHLNAEGYKLWTQVLRRIL
ncbi:SGNH/GDSL hydrolase family protein [bacterium]|nr:SGNH/GDSL hydrolase family protein [bacterium]MDG1892142.1 SGNH/GDSL hydrolase family protein [Verrucomicrobiota bacterium]